MDATPVSEICIVYETAPSKQIHWHDSLQIQYQLTGKAKATLQGRQYLMHEADVIVINRLNCIMSNCWARLPHFLSVFRSRCLARSGECSLTVFPAHSPNRMALMRCGLSWLHFFKYTLGSGRMGSWSCSAMCMNYFISSSAFGVKNIWPWLRISRAYRASCSTFIPIMRKR